MHCFHSESINFAAKCVPNSRLSRKLQFQEGVLDNTVGLEHGLECLAELTSPCLLLNQPALWAALLLWWIYSFFGGRFSSKQIAREAEAAMFHRQMFEELRRITHLTRDPTESVAIGTVEASFKCCASAIIVLTKTGR